MICPAIASESRTRARKTKSWNATWWAPMAASPKRVATAPASTNELMSAVVRMKIHFPSESTRRASWRRARIGELHPSQDHDEERDAHPELRDRGPPGRPLDPPLEAVHEDDLEDDVHGVCRHEDHERRAEVGDPAQVALTTKGEECGGEPHGGDAEVRDRVVGRLPLAAHERDERIRENRDERRDRDPEAEREPHRLGAEAPADLLLARPACARDLSGRAVLEEVEDREDAAEDGRGDSERREL